MRTILAYLVFAYLAVACMVFQFRHPKANDWAVIQELPSVLTFSVVPEFRK